MGGININPFDPSYTGSLNTYNVRNTITMLETPSADQSYGTWIDSTARMAVTMGRSKVATYIDNVPVAYEENGTYTQLSAYTLVNGPADHQYISAIQGSDGGDYYAASRLTNGGWTFGDIYPATIDHSAATITFGAAIVGPTIAGKQQTLTTAYGSILYVWYRDAVTGLIDTGRKYNAGWSTLSGTAIPTNVVAGASTSIGESFWFNRPPLSNLIPINDKLFVGGIINGAFPNFAMRFDYSTEVWTHGGNYPVQSEYVFAEVGGLLLLREENDTITLMDTSTDTVTYQWFGVMTIPYFRVWDMDNGFMIMGIASGALFTSANFITTEALQWNYLNSSLGACAYLVLVDGEYTAFTTSALSVNYGDIYRLAIYTNTSLKAFCLSGSEGGTKYVIYNRLT